MRRRLPALLAFTATLAMALGAVAPPAAHAGDPGAVTIFPDPQNTPLYPGREANSRAGIAAGPDGNIWFSQLFPNQGQYPTRVGRVTTDGEFRRPYTTGNDIIEHLALGPDGNEWFTERFSGLPGGASIGKITASGKVTRYPTCGLHGCALEDIAPGPDGDMYAAAGEQILGITPSGHITRYPVPPVRSGRQAQIVGVTTGPDGNIWFTDNGHDAVGRLTLSSGKVKEFLLIPAAHGDSGALGLTGITSFAGDIWVASFFGGSTDGLLHSPIGRMSTHGDLIAQYPAGERSAYLVAGPDGLYANAYFTTSATGWGVERITAGGVITLFDTPNIVNEVTRGPDDNIWFATFTAEGVPAIGRVTTGP